jgi:hypothetical protein
MSEKADRVHLIGSVPLPDCEAVFRQVAGELGPYLRRLPDGETGERGRWIFFQAMMLRAHPAMEEDPTEPPFRFVQWDGKVIRETKRLRFKPGVDPDKVSFGTGYDRAATESYAVFFAVTQRGRDPEPRPLSGVSADADGEWLHVCEPQGARAYLRGYERALLTALRNVVAAIPSEDLAIQWDVCQEVLVFENYFPRPSDPAITRRRSSPNWGGSATPCPRRSRWATTCATARRRTSMSCNPRTWRPLSS